jgi:hypothetical protein
MASKTVTTTISETDQKILNNDLLDIDAWVQNALVGKINNCWNRMKESWTNRLMDDESFTDPIPSNKEDFVTLILSRPDYTNRADQEINPKE